MNHKTQLSSILRNLLLTSLLVGLAASAIAQERLNPAETQYYAKLVHQNPSRLSATPLKIQPNLVQAVALREDIYGGLLIPDARLKSELIQKAGPKPVALGELWLYHLAPMRGEWTVAQSELNLVKVNTDEGLETVPRCTLGFRQTDNKGPELLVFGKTEKPLLTLPLKQVSTPQASPLNMTAKPESDRGWITLNVLGKYQARFAVTEMFPY